jgi:HSP20 family molecular chaperone IbpA
MPFEKLNNFFKTDFEQVFEKIEENIKNIITENINDNISIYIDDDNDMIIEIPAVGIEEENVSVEIEDNILIIEAKLNEEDIIEVPDEKKLKSTFEYKDITKKVKLSDKYVNGEFEVNVNRGLIFIIITPKEVKPKSRKIF